MENPEFPLESPPEDIGGSLQRRTKIVCTIGPASSSPDLLERMVEQDMDVARLNFSHGSVQEHRNVAREIRRLAGLQHRPVALLQDLAGPKIRIGEIEGGRTIIETGAEFTLTTRRVPGNSRVVSVGYEHLPGEVSAGNRILLADGAIELRVESVNHTDIHCRVLSGGELTPHKGINVPSGLYKLPILRPKDVEDLRVGSELGVDYVAVSFVRTVGDIETVRGQLARLGSTAGLIAKIETAAALENFDAILEAADGVMIARGDLSIETPFSRVPVVQKELITAANRVAKPAITATQMLFSMVSRPYPTRAEVADVANAVLDGSDAVMLSEETAVGAHPLRALEVMHRIIRDTEASPLFGRRTRIDEPPEVEGDRRWAMAAAAARLASRLEIPRILTITRTGQMARLAAAAQPEQPIVAATPRRSTYHQLVLVRNVTPLLLPETLDDYDEMVQEALTRLAQRFPEAEQVVLLAEDFVRLAHPA